MTSSSRRAAAAGYAASATTSAKATKAWPTRARDARVFEMTSPPPVQRRAHARRPTSPRARPPARSDRASLRAGAATSGAPRAVPRRPEARGTARARPPRRRAEREIERAAPVLARLGERIEEEHDVGVALRMLLVHPQLSAARARTPIDVSEAVTRDERPQVGELDSLAAL